MEKVLVIILVVGYFCQAMGLYGIDVFFPQAESQKRVLDMTSNILEIAYVCILSFSMHGVNKQLALFFD